MDYTLYESVKAVDNKIIPQVQTHCCIQRICVCTRGQSMSNHQCAEAPHDTVQVDDLVGRSKMDSRRRSLGKEPLGPQSVSSP